MALNRRHGHGQIETGPAQILGLCGLIVLAWTVVLAVGAFVLGIF